MNRLTTAFRVCAVIGISLLFGSSTFASDYAGIGNWNEDANWGGTQPAITNLARIKAGESVTVTDTGEVALRLIIAQSESAGSAASTLTIDSGDLTLATTGSNAGLISMGTGGGNAILNLNDGTLNAVNYDSRATAGFANEFNISGGVLNLSSGLDLAAAGDANLTITGSTADINVGGNTTLGSTGSLNYVFDAAGVSTLKTANSFIIDAASMLTIDGSAFTAVAGTYDLATFTTVSGAFTDPANITISGFTGFDAAIAYDSDSMNLVLTAVPEPSSLLFSSFVFGGFVIRRRRRRKATC